MVLSNTLDGMELDVQGLRETGKMSVCQRQAMSGEHCHTPVQVAASQ